MVKIKRALISGSDKTGIVDFAKGLESFSVEILSTGGTMKRLADAGVKVTSVSDYTGFPEMLDGRVKTLHPMIHGGLLAVRDDKSHMKDIEAHDIGLIDMVVVNLYPFKETVANPDVSLDDAIENIDIGGLTMLRSAAKNYKYVVTVCNPNKYKDILTEMESNSGAVSLNTRFELAKEVFCHTASYDSAIYTYLEKLEGGFPGTLFVEGKLLQDLRYGENPHQKAAFYMHNSKAGCDVAGAKQLSGKKLSYINIIDIDAALAIVRDFSEPAACIIKHTNPCGAGVGDDIYEAYQKALLGDPVSAFGSIVGLNRKVDAKTADLIASPNTFVEAIIASGYDENALELLKTKQKWGKNVRILEVTDIGSSKEGYAMKSVDGGILLQNLDSKILEGEPKVVTKRKPTDDEMNDLMFAWVICKHVKSNAIVYAADGSVTGVGAGQMSRVDSSIIARRKSGDRIANGGVLASDAFFPFRDGVDVAAEAGITAIIEPGGSRRDEEVIEAANEHDIAMLFTGMRHFRH